MGFILGKDLSSRSYILSGKKTFLYRFCDTGFKTKWTGLWKGSKKFLDYFAFKINDKWLSPENCHSFELSEIDASHHFSVDEIKIKEFLLIPEAYPSLVCLLFLENPSKKRKEVKVELEVAANIREREENWHEREYEIKTQERKVIVNSPKGSIVFGSSPAGNLFSKPFYKEHYPSNEKQRCFIPGAYTLNFLLEPNSTREILFIFALGENDKEAEWNFERIKSSIFSIFLEKERNCQTLLFNNKFESNSEEINRLFKWSVINLEKLCFESKFGKSYFAGFPWFTQFWGRDLGWTIPAIVEIGNFNTAKSSLKLLANFQSENGQIPNVIYLDGLTNYQSADSTPLWIIALNHYIMNSGDLKFLEEIKDKLFKALDWLKEKDSDKDGFIEHGNRETWMDTLDRGIKAIEIQALLIASLKAGENLVKRIWGEKKLSEKIFKLERKFKEEFWNEEENFYFDRITLNGKDGTKTINSVFPLVFGISQNPKKVLERIESEEFSSEFGVRTLSKNEVKYNPAGYHTGAAWGWITVLAACAEFKNKNPKKGLEYLKILSRNLEKNCLGAIGEAWNSETGNEALLKENLIESGACLQAWSSALVVRCVDEFMLGMKVNALENSIIFSPSLPSGFKVLRRKKIGNDLVDFLVKRIGKKVEIKYNSKNRKDYRIIVSPV